MKKFRLLLAAMLAFVFNSGVWAQTKEAYAEVSTDGTTLTFYYDTQKSSREGTKYPVSWTGEHPGWYQYRTTITTVDFDESFADYSRLSNTSKMFYNMEGITTISHLERLVTKNVQNMSSMFENCDNLQELNLSHFDTSNVKAMSYMFRYCSQLTVLDVSGFDVQKVTLMDGMFGGCTGLTSIYCDNDWMTMATALNSHTNMFKDCTSLKGKISYDENKTDANYANLDGYFTTPPRYNIWLAGTQLTSANLSGDPTAKIVNVTGINGVTGSVKFYVQLPVQEWDHQVRYTLYLDNATITNTCNSGTHLEGIYCDELLSISMTGTNTVSSTYGTGINFHTNWQNSLYGSGSTLSVKGTTGISVGNPEEDVDEPDSRYNVFTVERTTVTVEGTSGYGIIGSQYEEKYLNSLNLSNITIKSTKGAICKFHELKFGDEQGILEPEEGAKFYNNSLCSPSSVLLYQVVIGPAEREPYAVLSKDATTLTFYYDTQKATHDGSIFAIPWTGEPGWIRYYYRNIERAVIDESFARYTGSINGEKMFYSMSNLKSVVGLRNMRRCTFTSTKNMFGYCKSLESLNEIGYINTSEVSNMSEMFMYCHALKDLDLSPVDGQFSTANVTDMSYMFYECRALESLNISNFVTTNVTNMKLMFYSCNALASLDVSNFDTHNVTNMLGMFQGCPFTNIDLSNFNTEKVTNMAGMFYSCSQLKALDISNFKTGNVTDMGTMFFNCTSLESLTLSPDNFNTSLVTDMHQMFKYCYQLQSLDLRFFNTAEVTNMKEMFAYCYSLPSLDLTSFNTAKVTDMTSMFEQCYGLTAIFCNDDWNTDTVTSSKIMFKACAKLKDYKVSNANDVTFANPDTGYFTKRIIPGDANGDNRVTIADAVAVVSHLLGQTPSRFHQEAANVNGDSDININDVMLIVNMVLNQ